MLTVASLTTTTLMILFGVCLGSFLIGKAAVRIVYSVKEYREVKKSQDSQE